MAQAQAAHARQSDWPQTLCQPFMKNSAKPSPVDVGRNQVNNSTLRLPVVNSFLPIHPRQLLTSAKTSRSNTTQRKVLCK